MRLSSPPQTVFGVIGIGALGSVLLLLTQMERTACAQPALEQLEDTLQDQLEQADAVQPASGEAGNRPGAYLGIVGDDRQDRGRGVRVLTVREGGLRRRAA